MHFFLALFFKIFFIFIFFQHIIYVRRKNGGVKCAVCLWGFWHSSYLCRVFPARRLSKSAAESLTFLRDEVSAVQVLYQPLGLFFFCFFLVLQYVFLLIFNTYFVQFVQFSFGFSFWFSLCIRYAAPCFYVYIMKKTAAVLPAGVIVVVMKSVLLRRKPQAFIKRKLKPSGQKKKKRVQMNFQVYTFIENIFRT